MDLHIFSYQSLIHPTPEVISKIKKNLSEIGILGISDIPSYEDACANYINAVRKFTALSEITKKEYCPYPGKFEGYECGAEQFKDPNTGDWVIDDKKASFYAFIPDTSENIWPKEIDLKSAYLQLGELIFDTGKILLNCLGLNKSLGIDLAQVQGYGRMLHYQKEHDTNNINPNWCGAHFDHSLFTGLMPAYYFRDGHPITEPAESGLYIKPTHGKDFEKVRADDKSILLFQVGEFGQLASNDVIAATKHVVKKAYGNIERFTLAVFFNPSNDTVIYSNSKLIEDNRFSENQLSKGTISFEKWSDASFKRYDVSSDD